LKYSGADSEVRFELFGGPFAYSRHARANGTLRLWSLIDLLISQFQAADSWLTCDMFAWRMHLGYGARMTVFPGDVAGFPTVAFLQESRSDRFPLVVAAGSSWRWQQFHSHDKHVFS